MTQGDSSVLETLRVIVEADKTALTRGLTAAVQESRQAGQQMGQGLRSGLTASMGDLGSVGTQAGQQFGEGFYRDASGRLRNAKGKFVKEGQELGQGLADGLKQASPAVGSAVTGLTSALSGGGAGGGIGAAFGRLTAGAGGLSASLTGIVGVAGPAGAAIASVGAAAAAVIAPVNAAINVFAEFEYGLAKVSTLTDKTPQQLRGTGQEILRLSAEMGASFQSLNAGLYDILGAGVAGTESMAASLKFLEQAAMLAKAGATDTAVATDVLTSVMNAYKMSAEDAGDVSDKLFKAVDLGKMSFEQLAQSLGMVTAISSQAGVSLDEVLAALSTMTANGVQASSAVDYLRSLISSITKPSAEAAGLAKELGIAFNDQALKAKGLTGVLQEVMEKTDGSTGKLGVLFGGVEAVTAATSIASGEFARMGENIAAIGNSSGTTATAYGKMASTVQAENDKLAANWQRLMAGMGEVFAPFKVDVLSGLNELLNKANEVLEKWMQAKRLKSSGQDVMNLERQLEEQQFARQNAYARLRDPNVGADEKARIREDFLPQILAEINRLKRLIAEAKAEDAALRAEEYAANGGTYGPQPGGASTPTDYDAPTNMTAYQGEVLRQSLRETGVRTADEVVNYCAQWVRLTLGKADERVAGYVNGLFQKDRDGNGETDARDAAAGVRAAGLMRDYKGVSDLKPGDTVFYTEGGENHVGIYIGGGMVRGNNRVTYAANGGKFNASGKGITPGIDPVGNVAIDRLGNVSGYMSASDLGRAAGLVQAPKPTPTGGGAGGGEDKESPITAAQIVKAQQLLDAVEKAKKAMQADPKNNGLKIAYDAATQALNGWTAASKENARAAQAVRDSQTGAAKSASGAYIASSQELRTYGADALKLFKALEKAQASGSSQAVATAERNIALWIGESDAKKAVFQAESQAYRARQQQAEDARRQAERDGAPAKTQAEIRAQEKLEKQLRNTSRARLEQLAGGTVGENGLTLDKWKAARAEIERRDRLEDKSDAESRTRTQRRAELERQISADVTAGRIKDAERGLAALKRSQQEELDGARNSAVKRAEIIANTSPAILKAEQDINAKVRNQGIAAAQAWADEQTRLGVLSAEKIEAERVRRVKAAYKAESDANTEAQTRITQATQQANREAAAATQQHAREQAAIRARVADTNRQLSVTEAQQALARTEELNKQELASFKGTQAQRVAIVQRQATDEYNARVRLLDAIRDKEIADINKQTGLPAKTRERLVAAANDRYNTGELTARGQRDAAVRQATEQQAESVKRLRDEYSKLADQMRQGIASGRVTAADFDTWNAALADLERRTDAAGLSQNRFIAGARQNVGVLGQQALDVAIAAGAFSDLAEGHTLAAGAAAKQTYSLQDMLPLLPQTSDQVAGFVRTLEDFSKEGLITQEVMDTLLLLIPDFGGAVGAVGEELAEVEARLEGQAKRLDDLVTGYEQGTITADDYRDGLRSLADSYDLQAEAARRANNPALVTFFEGAAKSARGLAAEIRTLNDELRAIAERGQQALWEAENRADVPDVGEDYRPTADGGYEFGGDSTADAFLTAFTGESAGERLRNAANFALTDVFREAGQNAKEEFWTEFESELGGLSDDDLAALGADALRGILSGLGNDELLKGARDRVQAALNVAVDAQGAAAGWADLGAVLGQIGDGAGLSADTIRDKLLPELERIRSTTTDPKVKEAAEQAIGYLNSEIDATRELARLREEAALSGLDRRRASGQIGEGDFIAERQRLKLEQEEARYRLDIRGKTGKALELAEAQHQRNVAEIVYEGVDAQLALQNRLAEERLSITRRGQERELEARRQAGMPELAYIAERTRLAEQAARDEFDARVKGLKKGTPEYLAAEQALQSKLADIRQRGQFEAADSLEGAVEQLQASSRELASALGETERPFQNQIRLLLELKKKYPELTSQIDDLIGRYEALQTKTEALQKFNKYADMVGAVAGQMSKLGQAVGGNLGANITGIGNALSLAVDVAKDIATGNYVAAAMKVLSSLIDALAGFARAKREALEKQTAFNDQFSLFRGDDYARTYVKSRGFFADVFGGGPEVKQDIDKTGLAIAKTIADGVMNGMKTGFQRYLETGNMDDFAKAMETSVKEAIQQSLIDGFMNDPARMATYGDAIKGYTDARKSGDPEQIAAATAALIAAYRADMEAAKAVAEDLKRLQEELLTPEERARKEDATRRDLAGRTNNNDLLALEYQYKTGLVSTEQYERRKLELALRRIQLEMEAALAAEGLTQEQIEAIRGQYLLQMNLAQAEYARQEQLRAQELTRTRLDNEQAALDLMRSQGLIGQEEYERQKLALALRRIQAEMEAALAAEGLTADQIAAIRQKYALQTTQAQAAYDRTTLEQARTLAEARMNNEELALEYQRKAGLIGQEQYEKAKLELALKRLRAQMDAELAAEGVTAEQAALIREKYGLLEQNAREDLRLSLTQGAGDVGGVMTDALDSWRGALKGGIAALMGNQSPLEALHAGLRDRIGQAIQDGFIAKRITARLDPLFAELDRSLTAGMDPARILAQIGAALPSLSLEIQNTLGPLFGQLNTAIPDLANAVRDNTAAVKEVQFQQTTVVDFGRPAASGSLRQQLARFL